MIATGTAEYYVGGAAADLLPGTIPPPCFAGFCDWRLPTVKELMSLLDYSKLDPATNLPDNPGDDIHVL